jgi:hypothetical protein
VDVWIGPPLRARGAAWRDVVALREETAELVSEHCGEPRLDVTAARPVRGT